GFGIVEAEETVLRPVAFKLQACMHFLQPSRAGMNGLFKTAGPPGGRDQRQVSALHAFAPESFLPVIAPNSRESLVELEAFPCSGVERAGGFQAVQLCGSLLVLVGFVALWFQQHLPGGVCYHREVDIQLYLVVEDADRQRALL